MDPTNIIALAIGGGGTLMVISFFLGILEGRRDARLELDTMRASCIDLARQLVEERQHALELADLEAEARALQGLQLIGLPKGPGASGGAHESAEPKGLNNGRITSEGGRL